MSRAGKKRSVQLSVYLSEEEYMTIEKVYSSSLCRSWSEYLRDLILERPVTIRYRDTSLDDFITEMCALKRELSSINRNYSGQENNLLGSKIDAIHLLIQNLYRDVRKNNAQKKHL